MRHREVWNRARMLDEKDGKLFLLDVRPNERGSDASATRRTKNEPNGNPTCCSFSCAWHAKDAFRARFYRLSELISFTNHPQCFDERCRLKNLSVGLIRLNLPRLGIEPRDFLRIGSICQCISSIVIRMKVSQEDTPQRVLYPEASKVHVVHHDSRLAAEGALAKLATLSVSSLNYKIFSDVIYPWVGIF